jgi:hypothetical protein
LAVKIIIIYGTTLQLNINKPIVLESFIQTFVMGSTFFSEFSSIPKSN